MTLPDAISRVVETEGGVEILQHLDATHPRPLPIPPVDRLYRGQRSDWPLRPGLIRLIGEHQRLVGLRGGQLLHQLCQLEAESLIRFAEHADRCGISLLGSDSLVGRNVADLVPGDHQSLEESSLHGWPPGILLPLIGIAQHYGVKTRLLDLSLDPMVALHFALSQVDPSQPSDDDAVIWVFDRARFRDPEGQAQLVQVPTAGNPNLRAQSGIFLTDKGVNARVFNGLDRAYFEGRSDDSGPRPWAFKLLIPRSERHVLAEALKARRYDGVRLFPSLQSAGHAVQTVLYPASRQGSA